MVVVVGGTVVVVEEVVVVVVSDPPGGDEVCTGGSDGEGVADGTVDGDEDAQAARTQPTDTRINVRHTARHCRSRRGGDPPPG